MMSHIMLRCRVGCLRAWSGACHKCRTPRYWWLWLCRPRHTHTHAASGPFSWVIGRAWRLQSKQKICMRTKRHRKCIISSWELGKQVYLSPRSEDSDKDTTMSRYAKDLSPAPTIPHTRSKSNFNSTTANLEHLLPACGADLCPTRP